MYISKKDALTWFSFFAELPEDEPLLPRQTEIVYAAFRQMEREVERRNDALLSEIKHLKSLDGRTYFVGDADKFPQGCRSCLTGSGLNAVRKTNKCNLRCKYCYDYGAFDELPPIGADMWEIGGTKFAASDIETLLTVQKKPSGIAYVYLEPFMEIEEYYPVIRAFRDAGVRQHLYTNGTLANDQNLRALGEAGLDEIRFHLGASGCADAVIENMKTAKKYIPAVGVETPMTPAYFARFLEKKRAILDTGADFINCAELHLNPNNLGNFADENLYVARHGYISPVWSRELTLRLMKIADDEGWDTVVHDCSNRTKFIRDLNLRGKEGGWFGSSAYAREFDRWPYEAFLPILRDENFAFAREEPLPEGYRPGDLTY